MIQIFTDTSANLPAAYIQKYSLRVIPLHYSINGVQAQQDPTVDFDGKAYYDAMRSGAPMEVIENLQEIEDEGETYDSIEDIWPDYPSKEDFFFNEDEY